MAKKSAFSLLSRGDLSENIEKMPAIVLQKTLGRMVIRFCKLPKKKKIIIFTNLYYTGNTRAVYERMLERSDTRKRYDIYWMATNPKTYRKLKKDAYPVLYKHSVRDIKFYKYADLWVLAHRGRSNLPAVIQDSYETVKKIQLEHGVGPKATRGKDREYHLDEALCLSSEFIRERHIKMWKAPPEKLFATGFARMDLSLKYASMSREEILKKLGFPEKYRKIVLFAPTFDLGIWPWENPMKGLHHLSEYLKKKNTALFLRPHPYADYSRKEMKKFIKTHDNVFFTPMSKYPDTQLLLAATDVLITDWSSTYTDFLVTRRPIIFLEVNRDFFIKQRGKPEVPPELRPGIIVRKEEELYPALEKAIDENYIPDREFYEKCLYLIHGNPDGHYSDNVIKIIEKVLEKKG